MRFHFFLGDALTKVTRWFFPQRRKQRGWVLFGGCGFWLLVALALYLWITAKGLIWLTVLVLLFVAQGLSLLGDLVWLPVAAIRRR